MITSLRIENFKCWKDTGEFRLAPITGLFGTNSSGKTSILQFLLMLKQTTVSTNRNEVLNFGSDDRDFVELGDFGEVVFRSYLRKFDEVLRWSIAWELTEPYSAERSSDVNTLRMLFDELEFSAAVSQHIRPLVDPTIVVDFFRYRWHDGVDNSLRSVGMKYIDRSMYSLTQEELGLAPLTNRQEYNLPPPIKCYGFPSRAISTYGDSDFLADFALLFEDLFSQIYYLGPLREPPQRTYSYNGSSPVDVGRRGERSIEAIISAREQHRTLKSGQRNANKSIEKRIANWLRQIKIIHDFHIEAIGQESSFYRALVQTTSASAFVPLSDVGFGISQVLPVLTLCYYVPRGSILILEQPEIHLHPAVQTELADFLIQVSQERNLQIIVESHSEHLLTRLQRRIAEEAIPAADVALYFCHREEAAAQLTPLQLDEYGNITNWPKNFFGDEFAERAAMMRAAMKRQGAEDAA